VPEATTATQANIVNARTLIRESHARTQVAAWLSDIARLMLLTVRSSMQLPFMVQRHVDPFAAEQDPQDVQRTAGTWQEIQSEDIDGLDVDV
ncbi:hypothetical protein U2054_15540, partial [Listeria monocytogenes]|uniref:hypothetical protein n=1 Tax=Listeria monocytogenes TaxID=1639 RepID=UPI002FDC0E56